MGAARVGEAFEIDALRALLVEAFAVEERGLDVASGLAGATVIAGALAVGLITGNRIAGLTAALGALNVALCVPRASGREGLFWPCWFMLGGAAALLVADLASREIWVLVVVTLAWVGLWGMLRAVGPTGGICGFATAAVFVILAGIPSSGSSLGSRVWWFLAGAVAGLALMLPARTRWSAGDAPSPHAIGQRIATAARSDSALRGHVIRLAVAIGTATLIERALRLSHGYWVPLTVLTILQPSQRATQVRVIQRVTGTLIGVLLMLIATAITSQGWVMVVIAALCAFGLFALDERGYFWLVVMITPTALAMLNFADFQGATIGAQRTLDSALGIVIGLAIAELGWAVGSGGQSGERRAERSTG